MEEVPGAGAAAKGIDRRPGQVPPPTTDGMPRRTTTAAAEQGEAHVLHLLQVIDALDADDQVEDAGQQTLRQSTGVIRETLLGLGQPVQRRRQEEEGTRELRVGREKGGAGEGTGRPAGMSGMVWDGGKAGSGAVAGSAPRG